MRASASGAGLIQSLFADRIFTLMVATQLVLLAIALVFTPTVIALLAPGFKDDPGRFALAVELTRITFPYLLLVSLVTLYGGMLNALGRFASAAAAPILLNLSMIAALALAVFFPTRRTRRGLGRIHRRLPRGAAAGRRCLAAGRAAEFPLAEVRRGGEALPQAFRAGDGGLGRDPDRAICRHHHRGSLAAGALSALYYADRLNQLPIGVIGIAVGTVLLPEMANRLALGDEAGARHAQHRAIELTLLLSISCLVAFLLLPELIMRALFARGAFTAADAAAAGATLQAYAIGLLPFVLMRSAATTFLSRGDTWTPVKALFFAVLVNVALKVALYDPYAQVGLAFATSIGGWVESRVADLVRHRDGFVCIRSRSLARRCTPCGRRPCSRALRSGSRTAPVQTLFADWRLRDEASLALLALIGGSGLWRCGLARRSGTGWSRYRAAPRPGSGASSGPDTNLTC